MLTDLSNSIIRDNIDGNRLIYTSTAIRKIVDTPEFQRLRHIRQLGLASYVFPTAEHTRFSHSLGVYSTAAMAFTHLRSRSTDLGLDFPGLAFDSETQLDFLAAALCHDIGHSAFSHVLESTLLPEGFTSHEQCSILILENDTRIASEIKGHADIEAVRFFIQQHHPNRALNILISSQFDVDRCDYILRDSAMAGVEYGKYDLHWLLHSLTLETNEIGQPILIIDGSRGSDALKQFLTARQHLHRHVYFHPTVRSGQIVLKSIFARIWELGNNKMSVELAPHCFHSLISHQRISLGDFLRTTDLEVVYMIRTFAEYHNDPILKYLCSAFCSRDFPKTVIDTGRMLTTRAKLFDFSQTGEQPERFLFSLPPWNITEVIRELQELVERGYANRGLPRELANYLVRLDQPEYQSTPPTDLLFSVEGKIVTLESGEHPGSAGLTNLLDSYVLNRVYVPREYKDEARELIRTRFLT